MDDSTTGPPRDPGTTQPVPDLDVRSIEGEEATSPALSGFGRRLVARVIDYLVIVYGYALAVVALETLDRHCSIMSCRAWITLLLCVTVVAVAAYEILSTTWFGRTLGKRAMGIEVVRADGDGQPSYGRSTWRFLVLFVIHVALFPLVILVNFIASVGNTRKQMWQDRAGQTIVVRRTSERRGRRWLRVASATVVVLASLGFGGAYFVKKTLGNELIMVDFREAVDPFNIGESPGAKYDHVAGTYRVTVKNARYRTNTSAGDFARTAYAVGIRAEVIELTKPGTSVGVMCLGPFEGTGELVGYGFFVEPGGDFSLERQDPGGTPESLKQGTDSRIETVERVSIICAPAGNDVTLIGFANGLKVVVAEDLGGHDVYTDAGLSVKTEQVGTEVRFTRVSARVPDDEWVA